MNKQQIDPDAVRLREALPALQSAVAEGALSPSDANKALGKIADAISHAPPVQLPKRRR